ETRWRTRSASSSRSAGMSGGMSAWARMSTHSSRRIRAPAGWRSVVRCSMRSAGGSRRRSGSWPTCARKDMSGPRSPSRWAGLHRPAASSSRGRWSGLWRNSDWTAQAMRMTKPDPSTWDALDLALESLWDQGQRPDVRGFLEARGGPALGPDDVLAVLLVDQRRRWLAGERVDLAAYQQDFRGLADNSEAFFELLFHAFLIREELGERPDP